MGDMGPPPVFLGLGSNLGDREAAIERAFARLGARGFRLTRPQLALAHRAGGRATAGLVPERGGGRGDALSPEVLLAACLATEREMGRVRAERNGPRTIDVDVLLFGEERRDAPGLAPPPAAARAAVRPRRPSPRSPPSSSTRCSASPCAELLARCPDTSAVSLHAPRRRGPDGVPLHGGRGTHRGRARRRWSKAGGADRRHQGARGLGGEPVPPPVLRRQARGRLPGRALLPPLALPAAARAPPAAALHPGDALRLRLREEPALRVPEPRRHASCSSSTSSSRCSRRACPGPTSWCTCRRPPRC